MVLFIGLQMRGVGEAGGVEDFLGLLVLVALFGRPILLRHVKTESHHR